MWNAPKIDEQENSSLDTDCKLPTRLKKNPYLWDLKILTYDGLGLVDIAMVHLWYRGGAYGTDHTLMRECSAVDTRSDGSALVCLPGDFWLAWQLSLGT